MLHIPAFAELAFFYGQNTANFAYYDDLQVANQAFSYGYEYTCTYTSCLDPFLEELLQIWPEPKLARRSKLPCKFI